MKKVIAVIALCGSIFAQQNELLYKWNPDYACTGTDTFTIRITSTAWHDKTMKIVGLIGVYPVVKINFSQVAQEKIPVVCERIGEAAAAKQGWYAEVKTERCGCSTVNASLW